MTLGPTDRRTCHGCGRELGTIALPWKGRTVYRWQPCDPCVERLDAEYAAVMATGAAAREAGEAARERAETGVSRIAHLTFAAFDGTRLRSPRPADHPLLLTRQWLAAIRNLPHGQLHDASLPPPALFFYSPGKGCGKSHVAAASANLATEWGKLAVFLEESSYLERRWSCPLAELEQVTALPGDRAWLTVIDDLGQRAKASEAVSDAWYAVINRRWLKAGWTIFTSNRLPDELLLQGTLNEATYSRLMHLIRKRVLFFDGPDQRLM